MITFGKVSPLVAFNVDTASRAANRAKREILFRVPPLRSRVKRRYQQRLLQHRPLIPPLEPASQTIVDELRSEGVALTTLDDLPLPKRDSLRQELTAIARELKGRPRANREVISPSKEQLLGTATIWQWGLTEPLLDLVENYLGLPVRYCGAEVRRDLAHTPVKGLRQWHRDPEDLQQLKVLVWLDDVAPSAGPYQYIPRAATERASQRLGYVSGFLSDSKVLGVVPESEWRHCAGPAWSVVLTDPANVFHRVATGATEDRYSVTFSYTSHSPIKKVVDPALTGAQRARLRAGLSPRQLKCFPPA